MRSVAIAAAVFFAPGYSIAQDHGGHVTAPSPAAASSASSMAGYGAEERAAGLREGLGMGLAMPAETNGYPGPLHVVELADELNLAPDQRERMQRLFDDMRANASRLGAQLLAQEAELDALFRGRFANADLLETTARRIGETEAMLKVTHLRAHLATMEILSQAQVALYVELRRSGAGSGRTRPSAPTGDSHRP